ncbi:MAG: prepilin peptidase [Actinomycetota bacterium]
MADGEWVVWLTCGLAGAIALVAAVVDARTNLLRNVYTSRIAIVFAVGIVAAAIWPEPGGLPIVDAALGVLVFSGPWFVLHVIKASTLGFGDVKYTAALGLGLGWLGSPTALRALMLVLVFGGLHALVLAVVRRSLKETFPLGPSIFAGWLVATVTALGL